MLKTKSYQQLILVWWAVLFCCWGSTTFAYAQEKSTPLVYVLTIDGPIGPASHDYLVRGIELAQQSGANNVVLKLNTPGGLVTSMRSMTSLIMNSPIPVVVYVAPIGAQAASAGAFLVYAAHIAAMAPGTNIGAAAPISLGGGDQQLPVDPDNKDTVKNAPVAAADMKMYEDMQAHMRALAQHNRRNIEMGVDMIRLAKSYTAEEALSGGVVEYVTPNINSLLGLINNRIVMVKGKQLRISTTQARIVHYDPDWRNQLLNILTDPNITYILLLLGVYGVLLEFYNPGTFYSGVIGGICLLLAGYSLHLLPVDLAGLGLLGLGVVFLIFESVTPSYGIFGIGGIVAFIFGSIFLLDTSEPLFQINPAIIAVMALTTSAFFLLVARLVISSLRKPSVAGADNMLGKPCVAIHTFSDQYGAVRYEGNIYRAYSVHQISKDQVVEIIKVDGLLFEVKPVKLEDKE